MPEATAGMSTHRSQERKAENAGESAQIEWEEAIKDDKMAVLSKRTALAWLEALGNRQQNPEAMI